MPILLVAGVGVILLLFLFLLASPTFQKAIKDTYSGIPLIGGWLGENNARLIVFLYGRMAAWAASAVGAFTQLMNTLADLTYLEAAQLTNLATSALEALLHLRSVVIPAAVRQVEGYADQRLAATAAVLRAATNAVAARGEQIYAASVARMDREYVQAVGYAQHIGLWAQGIANQLWLSATHYAGQLFVRAETDARAGEIRSEAYTQASTAAAMAGTAAAFAVAIDYSEQVGQTAEGYAEALTGQAINRADLANAQTLAYASAVAVALGAAVQAIERSRCFRVCDTLGAVGEGLELLDLAAILALVEVAATHPDQAEAFLEDEVAPFVRSFFGGVADLVGAPHA